MSMRDKIEHAIQNQPCTVKELKQKFGGERGADRKVMEALDELVREAVVCQRQGVFFTVRSGRADKALLCKVVKLGKNFAFVMLEDGTSDIFIPGRFTRGAMPGDMVTVESSTSRVLGAAVIVYLVPFLLFFAGYFLCAAFRLSSGVSAAVGVAGFALGLLLAVLWDRRVRRQQAISFCITAIAPEA